MTLVTLLFSRAKNLKAATADMHDNVDKTIMAQDPFANTQSYLAFLSLQYYFLKDVSALYDHVKLSELITDLTSRRRLSMLEQDFIDLGGQVPSVFLNPEVNDSTDFATALGWLYVIEGSKVGAAMLGKLAQEKLSVSALEGARYLAGPGAGRGSAWRELVKVIDTIELDEMQELALIDGARQAFNRFKKFQAHVYS